MAGKAVAEISQAHRRAVAELVEDAPHPARDGIAEQPRRRQQLVGVAGVLLGKLHDCGGNVAHPAAETGVGGKHEHRHPGRGHPRARLGKLTLRAGRGRGVGARVELHPRASKVAVAQAPGRRDLERLRRLVARAVAGGRGEPSHQVAGAKAAHHVVDVEERVRRAPGPVLGRHGNPKPPRGREDHRAPAQGREALGNLVRRHAAQVGNLLGGEGGHAVGERPVGQLRRGDRALCGMFDILIHIAYSNSIR